MRVKWAIIAMIAGVLTGAVGSVGAIGVMAQSGYLRLGASNWYAGGTQLQSRTVAFPTTGQGVLMDLGTLRANVPDGGYLTGIKLDVGNTNGKQGASAVYGFACNEYGNATDTVACIGLWPHRADGLFVGMDATRDYVGENPTGVGILMNVQNDQDYGGHGYQCYTQGPVGACAYYRRDRDMNDQRQKLMKLRANNHAIHFEQDDTRTEGQPLIVVEKPHGLGIEWIVTNDGHTFSDGGGFFTLNADGGVTALAPDILYTSGKPFVIAGPTGEPLITVRPDGCIVTRAGTPIC